MFGEDCILGRPHEGRRQLSNNGSYSMQKTLVAAWFVQLAIGDEILNQKNGRRNSRCRMVNMVNSEVFNPELFEKRGSAAESWHGAEVGIEARR